MYRSCPLVQNFAKQGLKIRIRKESGPRPSRYTSSKRKNIRKASHTSEEDEEEEYEELEDEYNNNNIAISTSKRQIEIDTCIHNRILYFLF